MLAIECPSASSVPGRETGEAFDDLFADCVVQRPLVIVEVSKAT